MRQKTIETFELGPLLSSDKDTVVFLDVDGVVNHLMAADRWNRLPPGMTTRKVRGFDIRWPEWMPSMIQFLVDNHEVVWLTTWRDEANTHLAPLLGIKALPVIDDGDIERAVDWKAPTAAPIARALIDAGKRVVWIEDFYRDPPVSQMPEGVEFVDTSATWDMWRGAGLFPGDIEDLLVGWENDLTRA